MTISLPIRDWGFPVGDFFLAAGPCSAESAEQVLRTARALCGMGISVFRAGAWKPRTHPGSFEGAGEQALEWLVRARDETGLPIGVEVASAEHVELCLKHRIDLVWIGARTTPNPFSVQAVSDALRGTDMPVLVKNPISPDLGLWLGAIERLANAGLRRIGAVHRGFSASHPILYRYAPMWRIPIELKRRLPDIPLVCDPSHISGRRDLIWSISQEALDLLFDGLMVEVHEDPSRALSDGEQQLAPDAFRSLVGRLQPKSETIEDDELMARIKALRLEVDALDEHLVGILGKRMEVVRRLGKLKRRHGISALQPDRWREIVASRVAAGTEAGLSDAFVLQVFQSVHEEAIRQQETILENDR
ncbi:MAG TPA: bifunctional 3-deoxy-7-phosphoheptulonate synthase/chorismate mutase type II [Deferrisomatales bacterium]|nr:bifunctional 3-deoxy-7-phosphoheptulonate synthase/chorismate mutase type II [Deferrisomatales bacterium]